jgi:hypothetical protein
MTPTTVHLKYGDNIGGVAKSFGARRQVITMANPTRKMTFNGFPFTGLSNLKFVVC